MEQGRAGKCCRGDGDESAGDPVSQFGSRESRTYRVGARILHLTGEILTGGEGFTVIQRQAGCDWILVPSFFHLC